MATFNVDEMKADFQPVDIIFRGVEYVLGRNALGLMAACELHGTIEDKDGMQYLGALIALLPEVVKAMCPELDLPEDIDAGEQMAMVKICTEVLGRVSHLTFPEEEPEGNDA